MKKLMYLFLAMVLCIPAIAQDAAGPVEVEQEDIVGDQVYREIIIEDFEKNEYSSKNGTLRITKDQQFDIQMRTDFPAPVKDSKKYMGIKLYGKQGDPLSIKPPVKLLISDHAQSISLWVYGKNFSGELSIMLKDANEKVHRLSMGKLNFLGWRKLTYRLGKTVAQEDKFLSQPKNLEILQIIYSPGNSGRLPMWHYFYIDDISAKVRKKYEDKQTDNW
ncbi:MAG: hypothetical protein JW982_13065 [Spirochaetes bacterium]|nr:hypothetical protein [Spirochaetota bacterium]